MGGGGQRAKSESDSESVIENNDRFPLRDGAWCVSLTPQGWCVVCFTDPSGMVRGVFH